MKRTLTLVSLLCVLCLSASAQEKVFPLKNARADTDLDMNGFKLNNLDTSNLILGAGVYQPLNSTLTTISGLASQPYGLGFLQLANAHDARLYLSVISPAPAPKITNKWIDSFNDVTGAFTQSQPDFSNISGVNAISQGGTGQTTATAALNALLPAQAGHAGQPLITNGSTFSWSGSPTAGSGVANTIATLTGHSISNASDPTNGQVLIYNSSNQKWEPQNVTAASTGTVSSVSSGDATGLFTTSVTNDTSTPAIAFDLTDAPAHSVWGNSSGSSDAPSYIDMKIDSLSDAGTLSAWALLSAPTGNPVGDVDVQTLQNKTIDASNNTIKTKKYIRFDHPNRVDGSGAIMLSAPTADYNNQGKFSNVLPASGNWVEYRTTLPDDFDPTVAPRARLKIRNWSTNTGVQRYIFSMANVNNSAPSNQVMQNPISVDQPADSSGADADIETVGWVSLTGWAGALTPGNYFVIRISRDGSAPTDTSTADTVTMVLELEYSSIQ